MNQIRLGLAVATHCGALFAGALSLVACSGAIVATPRTPSGSCTWASYEGNRRSSIGTRGPMPHFDGLPDGAQVLGTATANCRAEFPDRAYFVSRLVNLDCSPKRLVEVVEEMAREVGGSSLWQLDCKRSGEPQAPLPVAGSHAFLGAEGHRRAVPGERLECTANVVGTREAATPSPPPQTIAASARERANAELQFNAVAAASRTFPAPEQVAVEVPYLPVADRSLGVLRVSMGSGTTESEVRAALAEAAGRLGATHVVMPTCWESVRPCGKVHAVVCQATVSTTLLGPRVIAEAR